MADEERAQVLEDGVSSGTAVSSETAVSSRVVASSDLVGGPPALAGGSTSGSGSELPEDDQPMSVFEHLAELRTRIIRAVIGMIPGVLLAWGYKERLLELLFEPLEKGFQALGMGEPVVHFANPVDPIIAYLKLAVVVGLLLSSPWVFWQLWAFIAPGLYRKEKAMAIPFVMASTVCFAGGAAFGYLVVFPMAFETLLSFGGMLPGDTMRLQPTLMITEVLRFSTRMLLAFGLVFEVPVVVSFLAMTGIVGWRQLLSFGRWWVVISAVLSSLLTPPDVASQLIMIVPLNVLYFFSVGLAYLFGDKTKPATSA